MKTEVTLQAITLQNQQARLLGALFDSWSNVQADTSLMALQSWQSSQALRGLQAYRSNASMLAQRVLKAAYPTLARLMGAEQFDGLAVHFWHIAPPIKGDLAQWGEGLSDFLRAIPELMASEPYLPDVAALDWALHTGQTAADNASNEPAPLMVIESEFAIVDLLNGKDLNDLHDQQGQSEKSDKTLRVLVYRQGFKTACIAIPKEIEL